MLDFSGNSIKDYLENSNKTQGIDFSVELNILNFSIFKPILSVFQNLSFKLINTQNKKYLYKKKFLRFKI